MVRGRRARGPECEDEPVDVDCDCVSPEAVVEVRCVEVRLLCVVVRLSRVVDGMG